MGGTATHQEWAQSQYKSLDEAKAASTKAYESGGPKGAIKVRDSGQQLGISYDNLTGLYKDQGAMGQYYNELYSGAYDNMAYKVEGVFDAEAAKQNPDTYQTPKDTYYKLGEAGKKEAESAGVEDRTGMGSAVKLADSGKTVKASDAGATQSRPAGKAGTIKKVNNIQI